MDLSMRMGGESFSTSGNLRVTVFSVTTCSSTGSFSNILMRDWTREARFALYLNRERCNNLSMFRPGQWIRILFLRIRIQQFLSMRIRIQLFF